MLAYGGQTVMLVLKFNYEKFTRDLCDKLIDAADESIQHFMNDAKSGLKSKDQKIDSAVLDFAKQKISTACVFYAHSILESYGRGTTMDMNNEFLDEYMASSLWNPLRHSKTIVGREKGEYTNFFGEQATSEGRLAGKPIGYGHTSPNIVPSYSIQNAEKKLKQGLTENGYVMRALRRNTESFLSSINPADYFYNEEVNV